MEGGAVLPMREGQNGPLHAIKRALRLKYIKVLVPGDD